MPTTTARAASSTSTASESHRDPGRDARPRRSRAQASVWARGRGPPPPPPPPASLHLVEVGRFDSPDYVAAPASERGVIYVVEQAGRIERVAGRRVSTFLDIRGRVLSGGERGLLSVAFHPDYAGNHLFYIDYTALNGNTVIAEYRAGGARPIQTRVLANFADPASNHNGGQLQFGPDGALWWGNGDGGDGGDAFHNGQSVS